MNKTSRVLTLLFIAAVLVSCAPKVRPELTSGPRWTTVNNNLHQIEGSAPDGRPAFRVYRSGAPSRETFAKWCGEYQIKRVIVMAGDADSHELKYQKEGVCPDIEILYNVEQKLEVPVTEEFLAFFDNEVARAKQDGVGLLFRCQTGSHRAGRMAAYYQMKYQGLTADEAIAVMDYKGLLMPLFDAWLRPQVRALYDYIHGRECSQRENACVRK